jgi:hypothetical protein
MKPWVAEETRRGLREAEDWRRERLRFHFELLERWRRLARGFLFLAGGEAIFLAFNQPHKCRGLGELFVLRRRDRSHFRRERIGIEPRGLAKRSA